MSTDVSCSLLLSTLSVSATSANFTAAVAFLLLCLCLKEYHYGLWLADYFTQWNLGGIYIVAILILTPVQIIPYLHQITRTTTQIPATTSATADTAIPATRTRTLDDPVCCHEGRQNKLYLVCEPDCEPLSLQNDTCGTRGCCTCTVNIIIIINIYNQ